MSESVISQGREMGAAYFIVLNNADPGFDPFVNGKAIAREVDGLSKVASILGLKSPDDYVSIGSDEAASLAEEFGAGDIESPTEQWFEANEGLEWVARLRAQLQADPQSVNDTDAVLADFAEYERVLSRAKEIGAMWHLSVDF